MYARRGLNTYQWSRLAEHPAARMAAYYAVLFLLALIFRGILREHGPQAVADPFMFGPDGVRAAASEGAAAAGSRGFTAALAMLAAGLLALPVASLYTITREKRGYRQSVVQTLVLLPLVVAGVVVLVKHSLALAFSLAGIVAAVRFRNTLEDSKDAVYIFVATGIGLAAGVDLTVAAVLSVIFNVTIISLWYADFGRAAALEGNPARQRLDRVLRDANRTDEFVMQLDEQVLKAMSAEQLEAVAERAWRRRKKNSGNETPKRQREYNLLRVRTHDVKRARAAVEPVMEQHLKRWRYGGVVHEPDGTHVVEYGVQLRRSTDPARLVSALTSAGNSDVLGTELD